VALRGGAVEVFGAGIMAGCGVHRGHLDTLDTGAGIGGAVEVTGAATSIPSTPGRAGAGAL
jgi:hypothetical protein